MSEVLARIRVKEEHGIRRFLYPLKAVVHLKGEVSAAILGLVSDDGTPVPLQASPMPLQWYRLDFGISLSPLSEQILTLVTGTVPDTLDDSLNAVILEDGVLQNTQRRFAITLGKDGSIQSVVYDGVSHLRGPSAIKCNGEVMSALEEIQPKNDPARSNGPLTAGVWATGQYPKAKSVTTDTEITACKSWVSVTHELKRTQPLDEVVFILPFAAVSSTLTYDLGLDGVYGKLEAKNNDVMTWQMQNAGKGIIQWSVATNDRTDYTGSMMKHWFQEKRWFHLVDGDKALAVAITRSPESCKEIAVDIGSDGEVRITFRMGHKAEKAVEFGVCYHFLNDVPAIAAATNPQSILLPPTVEVLPM